MEVCLSIANGIYRLASGDGGGFLVEVKDGQIFPMDPGGPMLGLIQVVDRTFTVSRGDLPIRINDDSSIEHQGLRYGFTLSRH